MAYWQAQDNEVHLKIAYLGPGLSGRCTMMELILEHASHEQRCIPRYVYGGGKGGDLMYCPVRWPSLDTKGRSVCTWLYVLPAPANVPILVEEMMAALDGAVFVAKPHVLRIDSTRESLEEAKASSAASEGGFPLVLHYYQPGEEEEERHREYYHDDVGWFDSVVNEAKWPFFLSKGLDVEEARKPLLQCIREALARFDQDS